VEAETREGDKKMSAFRSLSLRRIHNVLGWIRERDGFSSSGPDAVGPCQRNVPVTIRI